MSTTPTAALPNWLETAARAAEAPDAPEAKPRLRPPAPPATALALAEEVEMAWHGYDLRALGPSTVVLGLLTAGALLKLRPFVPSAIVPEVVYAPLAALWAGQAIRAAYRLLGYNYRLTTRRLFPERGPLYPPAEPLDLAAVARVEVRQSPLQRLLGVGVVCVVPDDSTGRPTTVLAGVGRPQAFAAQVEETARAARAGNVATAQVG